MSQHEILKRNRYFEVLGDLNSENHSDNKVGMIIEVDMTLIERHRFESKTQKPSYTAFLLKAVANTLAEQKYANRIPLEIPFFRRIVQLFSVDISVAVEKDNPEFEQAVYVATIRDANKKSLREITDELKAFTLSDEKADPRWKAMRFIVEKIPSVWLAKLLIGIPKYSAALWIKHRGGSAMISSPSKYGVDTMIGTWPWPLGFSFGLVKERVVAIKGKPEVRTTMSVTFSFDRRLMGGAPAARFFRSVCDKLENFQSPETNAQDSRRLEQNRQL